MQMYVRGEKDEPGETILRIIIIDHKLHRPREFDNSSGTRNANLLDIHYTETNLCINYLQ